MTPPINIDGTQITGASIDGSEVTAVTVDGTEVFSAISASGISQYKFEQDVTDSFGTNGGTNNGISFSTNAKVGTSAGDFDGTDTVNLGNMSDLEGLNALSIVGHIFPRTGMLNGENYGVYWQSNETFTERFGIRFGVGGNKLVFTPDGNVDASVGINYSNLSTGKYQHIGGTFDGSTGEVTIYLNGSQEDTATTSITQTPTVSGDGKFGRGSDWGENFDGLLDHFSFYDKELSQTEVQSHLNTGSI